MHLAQKNFFMIINGENKLAVSSQYDINVYEFVWYWNIKLIL